MTSIPRRQPLAVRREFARYQFYMLAEIAWQARKRWGRVTDISRAGMFIEIPDPPCLDASFTAHLALNVPLRINCVVRRVVPNRGVGVTFSVSKEGKKRVEALLLALGSGATGENRPKEGAIHPGPALPLVR